MQEIKEILEKIERPRNKDELVPAWWVYENILFFVDQALAKLKEEPPQGEFTKNIMANLERWEPFLSIQKHCRIRTIVAWLKEACRRYDWLVKRNAKLQAENKSQSEHIELLHQCDDSATEVIAKMDSEIENLLAEKDKLIEGQQAMKGAGS